MTEIVGGYGSGSAREILKRVYSTEPATKLWPEYAKLLQRMGSKEAIKTGDGYHYPVHTRLPQGSTFKSSSNKLDAFSIKAPVAGKTLMARAQSTAYTLEETIPMFSEYATAGGDVKDGPAFEDLAQLIKGAVVEKADFDLEATAMYGQTSYGVVLSNTAISATQATIVVTEASWAPILWHYMENGSLDIFDSTGSTQRNTGTFTLDSVDLSSRTLTISCSVASDLTDVVANDIICPAGARTESFVGLDYAITNSAAGSGTIFGINTATTSLWRASTYAVGGALTFADIVKGQLKSVNKSGPRDDLTCFCSTYSFVDMMNNQASLRIYGDQYKGEFEQGASKLVFHGVGGKITIEPYALCKAGEAWIMDFKAMQRIGDCEPTFVSNTMDKNGEKDPFFLMENYAGWKVRRAWDQALALKELAPFVKLTGIVNTVAA